MVREGIVLGHKIFARGIEVDREKYKSLRNYHPPLKSKAFIASWDMLGSIGGSSRTFPT